MRASAFFETEPKYYEPIEPYHVDYLKVSEIHEIYFEESGNPQGQPILFLHGGPGGNTKPYHRQYFDPAYYRIILFDQRGSGRSKPFAELRENTTRDLIADMERLREHLGIEDWILFGGSWGSTLSLLYAITHPKRVGAMILRGIFLGREKDIAWSFRKGVDLFYPEEYETFLSLLSQDERENYRVVEGYYRLLTSEDVAVRNNAAKVWSSWEGKLISLLPNEEVEQEFSDLDLAVSLARLECHYFIHHLFIPENYILNHVDAIASIPTIIIHGRYDMDCPVKMAYLLHKQLPKSELWIIEGSGHSAGEPKIAEALIKAADLVKTWR